MKIIGKIRTNPSIKVGDKEGVGWKLVIYDINRETYSTFNEDFHNFGMGDEVEVEYEKSKDGKYNNIKTMNLVGNKGLKQFKEATEETGDIVDTQRLICRQNSLTQANDLLKTCYERFMPMLDETKDPIQVLCHIAKEIEDWIFRE